MKTYYAIQRAPGLSVMWAGWFGGGLWISHPAPNVIQFDTRRAAHSTLADILLGDPGSRAIVVRVHETEVTGPGETRWVVMDAGGRYRADCSMRSDWISSKVGARDFDNPVDAARALANLVYNGQPARSIEPIKIGSTTRIEREILPEVEP